MVSFAQVIFPILASAVLVFIASSLIHTVIKYHKAEYRPLPNEDDVRAVVRAGGAGPGQYIIPYCSDPKQMQSEAMKQKLTEGPVGALIVRANGPISMGPMLGSWFALNLFVAAIAGYLACSTLPAGTSFLAVCRLVGGVTFLAYGVGSVSNAIWWGKPWSATFKELIDAFIYGLLSALAFGYLWPR
jgi:hypothetical protein